MGADRIGMVRCHAPYVTDRSSLPNRQSAIVNRQSPIRHCERVATPSQRRMQRRPRRERREPSAAITSHQQQTTDNEQLPHRNEDSHLPPKARQHPLYISPARCPIWRIGNNELRIVNRLQIRGFRPDFRAVLRNEGFSPDKMHRNKWNSQLAGTRTGHVPRETNGISRT